MSVRRYSSKSSSSPAIFAASSSSRSSCASLAPLGGQQRRPALDRDPVVEHRPGALVERLAGVLGQRRLLGDEGAALAAPQRDQVPALHQRRSAPGAGSSARSAAAAPARAPAAAGCRGEQPEPDRASQPLDRLLEGARRPHRHEHSLQSARPAPYQRHGTAARESVAVDLAVASFVVWARGSPDEPGIRNRRRTGMGRIVGNRVHLARRGDRGPGGGERATATAAGPSTIRPRRGGRTGSSSTSWSRPRPSCSAAVTYEGFAAAWPEREDEAGFAKKMNSMPKYVFSTTLEHAEWQQHHRPLRRLRRGDRRDQGRGRRRDPRRRQRHPRPGA